MAVAAWNLRCLACTSSIALRFTLRPTNKDVTGGACVVQVEVSRDEQATAAAFVACHRGPFSR